MYSPLVSVICTSYNHASFVEEAVLSVMQQTYPNIEMIIIDNASKDETRDKIDRLRGQYPDIKAIYLDSNIGNCRAFNIGLQKVRGDFIIDLSADDVLMDQRIEEGIRCFLNSGEEYGVNYSDAVYIDDTGRILGYHFKRDEVGRLALEVPQGRIYTELLGRYIICTPTMMIRRSVLDQLGGYDENLAYEDFDFWVRSGKITKYCYTDQVLVKKRILKNSLSAGQYKPASDLLYSTYLVCLKAERLNETEGDRSALLRRSHYEFRKALISRNFSTATCFSGLLLRNMDPGIIKIFMSGLHMILRTVVPTKDKDGIHEELPTS